MTPIQSSIAALALGACSTAHPAESVARAPTDPNPVNIACNSSSMADTTECDEYTGIGDADWQQLNTGMPYPHFCTWSSVGFKVWTTARCEPPPAATGHALGYCTTRTASGMGKDHWNYCGEGDGATNRDFVCQNRPRTRESAEAACSANGGAFTAAAATATDAGVDSAGIMK